MQGQSARSADQRSLVVAGVSLALLAVAVQTALYLADVYAFDRRVRDVRRGRREWTPGLGRNGCNILDGTGRPASQLRRVVSAARACCALAGAVTFLSFDESLVVHERVGLEITEALDLSDKYLRVAWPAAYVPLLAAIAALVFQLARTSTDPARRLLLAGLLALAAAVGLEIAGLALDLVPSLTIGLLYTVQIALEEGAELAGWILLTTGLVVRLLDQMARQVTSVPRP